MLNGCVFIELHQARKLAQLFQNHRQACERLTVPQSIKEQLFFHIDEIDKLLQEATIKEEK